MWSSKIFLTVAGTIALGAPAPAPAAVDLAALQVEAQRGQTSTQTRRDRYECHNGAVQQSGEVPLAAPPADETRSKGRRRDTREDTREASDYVRALLACLEGRGYGVTLPEG